MVRGAGMTFKREGRSGILSVCIAVLAVIMVFGLSSFSEAVNATTSGKIESKVFLHCNKKVLDNNCNIHIHS